MPVAVASVSVEPIATEAIFAAPMDQSFRARTDDETLP
jgi:uncharacterized protein YndB with AHSA1/START domain